MRRSTKVGIWGILGVALLLVLATIVGRAMQPPPVGTLSLAVSALEAAGEAATSKTAAEAHAKAGTCLEQGREAMNRTSDSWLPFRSYHLADSLLNESIRLSHLADSLARRTKARLEDGTVSDLAELTDSLAGWRRTLDHLLPRSSDEVSYKKAEFWRNLASEMTNVSQYEQAAVCCDSVRAKFKALEASYAQRQTARREGAGLWQGWIKATIDNSRRTGKTAVIVSKADHRLYVLRSGKIVDSLPCELGYNSGHQKRSAGDGATPEGMYRATHINKGSKYYRAILLNYPNEDDRARFAAGKKSGAIPSAAKIGGLIEIHGHGGSGKDWTDGCVAVTDKYMDKLLKVVPVGTAVTIVREWKVRP